MPRQEVIETTEELGKKPDPTDWVDMRPAIPRPVIAHDAKREDRKVEARLWLIETADRPYQLRVTLQDKGATLEVWANDYSAHRVPDAARAYRDAQHRAERWLEGWPLVNVRPGWTKQEPGEKPGPEHK